MDTPAVSHPLPSRRPGSQGAGGYGRCVSASEFILVVIVVVLVAVCGGLLSVLRRQAAARTGLEAVPEDVLGLRQEVAALRARRRARCATCRS